MSMHPAYAETLKKRILSRIVVEDRGYRTPCWISTRARGGGQRQYTKIGIKRATREYESWYTHRLAYVLWIGPIPKGREIDHRCDQPECCNPRHLAVVGRRENLLRSRNRVSAQRAQDACIHGHRFDEENTYVDRRGRRHCRTCSRRRRREAVR